MGLAGRAGLGEGAGLSLSYNSLVWTKDGGFDQIQRRQRLSRPPASGSACRSFRATFQTRKPAGFSYMMIMPSGDRVDLRKVGKHEPV